MLNEEPFLLILLLQGDSNNSDAKKGIFILLCFISLEMLINEWFGLHKITGESVGEVRAVLSMHQHKAEMYW